MSYFYSETNKWSKDGGKQWALRWSATTSRQFHQKFHFTWNKKVTRPNRSLVAARNLQIIKTFLTLELSQYCKIGSTFFSSEPVAVHSDCCLLGNALRLCLPVRPAQAVPERGPNSSAFGSDFAVKTFDRLLEKPLGVTAKWPGASICCLTNKLSRVYLLWSPWINCVEFKMFLGQLKILKLRTAVNWFQPSSLDCRATDTAYFWIQYCTSIMCLF